MTDLHEYDFQQSNVAADNLIHMILNYSKMIIIIHLVLCLLITYFTICDIVYQCKKLIILTILNLCNVTNVSLYEIIYNCVHIKILTLNINLTEVFTLIKYLNNINKIYTNIINQRII